MKMRTIVMYSFMITLSSLIIFSSESKAVPQTNFKQMIFPLECFIDTLDTGVNNLIQLTPENCLNPPDEQVPSEPSENTATSLPIGDDPQSTNPSPRNEAYSRLQAFGIVPLLNNQELPDAPIGYRSVTGKDFQEAANSKKQTSHLRIGLTSLALAMIALTLLYRYERRN